MKNFYKHIIWGVVSLILISFLFSAFFQASQSSTKLSLNELADKINSGEVNRITINGDKLTIQMNNGSKAASEKEAEAGLSETLTNFGVTPDAMKRVKFQVENQSGFQFWAGILIPTVLPFVVIGFIFW